MRRILHFLLWVLGVALGVGLFFAAVLGISYAVTGESKLPDSTVTVDGTALQTNGFRWNVPLLGGTVDKTFEQPRTLSVQKLGTLTVDHPALAVPEWAGHSEVTVENEAGAVLFYGTLAEYDADFIYPANGEYKLGLTLWHLPGDMTAAEFEAQGSGPVVKNSGRETPVRPTGWYHYTVRFTLQATPAIHLSDDSVYQGEAVGVLVTGLLGDGGAPTAQCELGPVVFERVAEGWRGYLPVAYNAEAGEYTLTVTGGDVTAETVLRVSGKDFGRANADDVVEGTTGGTEFRSKIWALYDAASGPKAWVGRWTCPVAQYTKLVSFGQVRVLGGQAQGRSNSSVLITTPGDEVVSPTGGTVAFAGCLQLTGNTVVIDHGCGVRTYLYGLDSIDVKTGDEVLQNGPVGIAAGQLTLDVKIGNKSIDPWALFRGDGGLFWRE